jgi:hypothetical protein
MTWIKNALKFSYKIENILSYEIEVKTIDSRARKNQARREATRTLGRV